MEPFLTTGSPLVVLNPAANRGKMQQYRELARQKAAREGARYVETTRSGEAEELAKQAASEGCPVIVVGGDGSVHEVVNGLLASGRRVPLGIVGAGSGNDFAWNTLRLPRDPAQALERAFSGALVDVDAGQVNGRYFANAFSVGLDADIAVAAQSLKRWPLMSGERLYYGASLKQLLFGYQRCPRLSFKLDECEWVDMQRYVVLAVSNGPTYGGGFRINPTADHTDGWFHICAIRYIPLVRALRLLPIVQRGEHASVAEAHFFQAKKVQIESLLPVTIQMDGETSSARSYRAEVLAGVLQVRV
ncbi:MAG TPA: diacylglycerol kinase family protein [Ktedonobacteraceae bacterium]|nr:diacylglycerol kinase family protein [Ktedonobacteraceae bacterium]